MEVNDPISEAAQDNTAPAADGQQQGSVNMDTVLDGQDGAAGDVPQPKQDAESNPVNMGTMLDDDGEQQDEGTEGDEEPGADGEQYALTFTEGVVADPEAVKVLNEVGKEFGITGEKAQTLATAATEYAGRQVKATIDGAEKKFVEMRLADRAATKKAWGANFDAYRTEAGLGLARMERDGLLPKDFKSSDLQFLLEKEWFLNILRREHQRNAEQPGFMGERGGTGSGGDSLDALYPGLGKKKK